MVFGNGVKNIQAAAYNGARTVYGKPQILLWISMGVKQKNFVHLYVNLSILITYWRFYIFCKYQQVPFHITHQKVKFSIERSLLAQRYFLLGYSSILICTRGHSSITSSRRWVGGIKKWKFLMIYSTVNHQRVGWVGLKKSKTR